MPNALPRPSNRPPRTATGSPLALLRLAAGLTQEQLAELAGVSERTIRRMEKGDAKCGHRTDIMKRVRRACRQAQGAPGRSTGNRTSLSG